MLNQLEVSQTIQQPSRSSAWGQLLTDISRIQLADRKIAAAIPDHKIDAGWLGEPGATEEEITVAERRLGVRCHLRTGPSSQRPMASTKSDPSSTGSTAFQKSTGCRFAIRIGSTRTRSEMTSHLRSIWRTRKTAFVSEQRTSRRACMQISEGGR
jgi:hypothetical protein